MSSVRLCLNLYLLYSLAVGQIRSDKDSLGPNRNFQSSSGQEENQDLTAPEPGDPVCVTTEEGATVYFNGTFMFEPVPKEASGADYGFDVCYIPGSEGSGATAEGEGHVVEMDAVTYLELVCFSLIQDSMETWVQNRADPDGVLACQIRMGSIMSTGNTIKAEEERESPYMFNATEPLTLQVINVDREPLEEMYSRDKFKIKVRNNHIDQGYRSPVISDCWYNIQPLLSNLTGLYVAGEMQEEEEEEDIRWSRWMDDGCTTTSDLYQNRIKFVSIGRIATQTELALNLQTVIEETSSKSRFYIASFKCQVYLCPLDTVCTSTCRERRGYLHVPKNIKMTEVIGSVVVEDLNFVGSTDHDTDGDRDGIDLGDSSDDGIRRGGGNNGIISNTQDPDSERPLMEKEQTVLEKYMPYLVIATLGTVVIVMIMVLYLVCHIGCSQIEPTPDYPSANEDDVFLQTKLSTTKSNPAYIASPTRSQSSGLPSRYQDSCSPPSHQTEEVIFSSPVNQEYSRLSRSLRY